RVASNIGISQSTFSVKVLNLFSRSRRKTNKRKSKHSAMLRNKETRHRMFIGLLDRKSGSAGMPRPISYAVFCLKKKTIPERDKQLNNRDTTSREMSATSI